MYGIYSIRDVKTGYLSLLCEPDDAVASRNFEHAVRTADGLMRTHPQDFALYKVGTYDSEHGHIEPLVPVVHILDAASIS